MSKKQPPIAKFLLVGGIIAFGTQLLVLCTTSVTIFLVKFEKLQEFCEFRVRT
jgi:hypothetical protein